MDYIESDLIDSDGNMDLTVHSLIEITNIVTDLNNVTLRNFNVKSHGFDKMYMDKDLVEDKLHQIIKQFNERNFTPTNFYSILLNKMDTLNDGNERTSKVLFANDDGIIKRIGET